MARCRRDLTDNPSDSDLETAFGYTFEDRALLRVALTHRSWANERGEEENYERLEFLGDSVLGLIASQWLYERFPGETEGQLAKLKSFLVSAGCSPTTRDRSTSDRGSTWGSARTRSERRREAVDPLRRRSNR